MGLFGLPKPGHKFIAKRTYGSFANKLKKITRYGDLKNLADNIPSIISAIGIYEKDIRRGGLSYWQKMSVLKKIKKMDKNLSENDLKEIKKILNYLGKE